MNMDTQFRRLGLYTECSKSLLTEMIASQIRLSIRKLLAKLGECWIANRKHFFLKKDRGALGNDKNLEKKEKNV